MVKKTTLKLEKDESKCYIFDNTIIYVNIWKRKKITDESFPCTYDQESRGS